jgi:hypothetical protein
MRIIYYTKKSQSQSQSSYTEYSRLDIKLINLINATFSNIILQVLDLPLPLSHQIRSGPKYYTSGNDYNVLNNFINENADLIIVHSDIEDTYRIIKGLNIPVINILEINSPYVGLFELTQLRNNILTIVNSVYWQSYLIEKLGFQPTRIKVIYPYYDDSVFYSIDFHWNRNQIGFNQNDFIVLYNARNGLLDLNLHGFLLAYKEKPMKLFLLNNNNTGYLSQLIEIYCEELKLDKQSVLNSIINYNDPDDNMLNKIYNACNIGININSKINRALSNLEHACLGFPQIIASINSVEELYGDVKDNLTLLNPKIYHHNNQGREYYCSYNDLANSILAYYYKKTIKDNVLSGKLGTKFSNAKADRNWKSILCPLFGIKFEDKINNLIVTEIFDIERFELTKALINSLNIYSSINFHVLIICDKDIYNIISGWISSNVFRFSIHCIEEYNQSTLSKSYLRSINSLCEYKEILNYDKIALVNNVICALDFSQLFLNNLEYKIYSENADNKSFRNNVILFNNSNLIINNLKLDNTKDYNWIKLNNNFSYSYQPKKEGFIIFEEVDQAVLNTSLSKIGKDLGILSTGPIYFMNNNSLINYCIKEYKSPSICVVNMNAVLITINKTLGQFKTLTYTEAIQSEDVFDIAIVPYDFVNIISRKTKSYIITTAQLNIYQGISLENNPLIYLKAPFTF